MNSLSLIQTLWFLIILFFLFFYQNAKSINKSKKKESMNTVRNRQKWCGTFPAAALLCRPSKQEVPLGSGDLLRPRGRNRCWVTVQLQEEDRNNVFLPGNQKCSVWLHNHRVHNQPVLLGDLSWERGSSFDEHCAFTFNLERIKLLYNLTSGQ